MNNSLNKALLFIALIILTCVLPVSGQSNYIQGITSAITKGNAHELSDYFFKNVNVRINATEGLYSKVQAEQMFENFFLKNKAYSYQVVSKGKLSENSEYIIASYKTEKESFRVYLMMKGSYNQEIICQISFKTD